MTLSLTAFVQLFAMVLALVCFALHAGNVQPSVRPNLVGLGLACLTAGLILAGLAGVVPR